MRKFSFFLIAFMILCLAVACGDSNSSTVENIADISLDIDNLSESDISVSSNQKITIENLNEGEFLALVPVSSSKSAGGTAAKAGGSSPVLKTNLGTFLPMRDGNGKVEFYGSDLEVDSSSRGSFRPIKLASGSAYIDLNENPAPSPTFSIPDKAEYYEKFISYDLTNNDGITDSSKVVIIDIYTGGTGDYISNSHDHGILNVTDWNNRKTRASRILDLSDRDHIFLYLGFSIEARGNYTLSDYRTARAGRLMRHELVVTTPYTLKKDAPLDESIAEKKVVMSDPESSNIDTSTEYCLVIDSTRQSDAGKMNETNNVANAAYPHFGESGSYRGYFIPYYYDSGDKKAYIYLGKIDQAFYFKCDTDNYKPTMTLTELPDGHKDKIGFIYESSLVGTEETALKIKLDSCSFKGCEITTDSSERANKARKLYVKYFTDEACTNQVDKTSELADYLGADIKVKGRGYGNGELHGDSVYDYIDIEAGFSLGDICMMNSYDTDVWVKLWITE